MKANKILRLMSYFIPVYGLFKIYDHINLLNLRFSSFIIGYHAVCCIALGGMLYYLIEKII